MAHLMIHLGGSAVVPFRFPLGLVSQSRGEFSARGVRWKALREAATTAEYFDVVSAMRSPQLVVPQIARAAPRKEVSK